MTEEEATASALSQPDKNRSPGTRGDALTTRRAFAWLNAPTAVLAAALTARCSSTPAPAKPEPPPCVGTLGIDVRAISPQVLKTLGLPRDLTGALVTEVLPGGPGAEAGIRPNDVVEEIGTTRIVNDCEFDTAAFNRSCGPVRVEVFRAGSRIEMSVIPVDQKPFLEKACQDGNASACFRQGWLLWSRKGGPNSDRALELFTAACKAGSASGCAYESLELMDVPERGSEALAAADKSCDRGSGSGCANLAFLYATGKLVKKDDRRALSLYNRSCDLGDPQGCYNVALMTDEGRGGPRDLPRAVAKYEEACTWGSSTGCTNLGYLYENGHGVKTDKLKAVALYQHGCDGTMCQRSNLGGCVNVGRAYRDGIGVAKDEPHAATIFEEACNRKLDPDDIHAAENSSRACSLLGGLYIAGDGIPKDLAKGLELSQLGCGRGDSFGCFNAAAVYSAGEGVPADAAKADSFLDLACNGGDGEACFDLGVAYEKGNGVTADRKHAAELYRKACQLGFAQACAKKTAK